MEQELPDLFVAPDLEAGGARVSFTAPAGMSAGTWRIMDQGRAVASGAVPTAGAGSVEFWASIPDCRPWSLDHPCLYELALELDVAGRSQSCAVRFGMRSIRAAGRDILVNGRKFYARGYIRGRAAHDHPNLENLSLTAYYEKNIRAAKAYGFNLIRFHSTVPPEECFEVADRLGIFIHLEARKYYGRYQKERRAMRDDNEVIDEREWRAVILRLRNHPSLLAYCIGNEIKHPGKNPFIAHIAAVTRELDPTRLFIDTCAHGEYDRTYVDFDVQHMSYYYPFGKDYDMFDNTYNWLIYGSCQGNQLTASGAADGLAYTITRAIRPERPVLAHEVCHYIAWRDLDALDAKFQKHGVPPPWWLAATRKLAAAKGQLADYGRLRAASKRFQFISWKLALEAARRSPLLSGFHFLQLSDTDRYENSNGILDCFDDAAGVDRAEFMKFNGDSVLLADLPRRVLRAGGTLKIPVWLSHYAAGGPGAADFGFALHDTARPGAREPLRGGILRGIDLRARGLREICSLELTLPAADRPLALKLCLWLQDGAGRRIAENDWQVWCTPPPASRAPVNCTIALDEIQLAAHCPRLRPQGSLADPAGLLIVNRFSAALLAHLARGGDALVLYRVPETRDRRQAAPREQYWLPAVWDRFKGVIWDRGHNCGAIIEPHPSFAGLPHDGFADLQFHALINDCDKINLDNFPVKLEPIMRGVDRPVRDRFDVFTYQLSELQPEYTMRNFAYAFEVRVGPGRLFVTGLNFTGLNQDLPEARALFDSILDYAASDAFRPAAAIEPAALARYLREQGAAPRPRERKMTQYWQLDDAPLESAAYWKESEEYIAGAGKFSGQ